MADSQHTHAPTLLVGVRLDGMTWAELRAFVHLCRDVGDEERVGLTIDPNGYEYAGLEEFVPASAVMPDGS